ncbi:MAG: hypothetical protein LBR47_02895 [Spirochaetaceae bacterium]|nr:hypothetical protein [Spirochaetaceae bacterium]
MYFNELTVDLNDEQYFSFVINGQTKENPNESITIPCTRNEGSLDEYANVLIDEALKSLHGE